MASWLLVSDRRLTWFGCAPLAIVAAHRCRVRQSTDIYKRLLLENREDLAVNVYVAMCYYKVRKCEIECGSV